MLIKGDETITIVADGVHEVTSICILQALLFQIFEQLFVNYLRQKGVGDKSPKLILLEVKTQNLVIIGNDWHIGPLFLKL